jgi:HSP20 family protein
MMSDLIPWGRSRSRNTPAPYRGNDAGPFSLLQGEMNRLFDDFFRGFDLGTPGQFGWTSGWPHMEVSDTGQAMKVVAELPGLEEKDVEVTLQDGVLTLKGEKKSESDGPLYSERWHGQFQR